MPSATAINIKAKSNIRKGRQGFKGLCNIRDTRHSRHDCNNRER
jgi:hypothetical protein